MPIKGLTDNMRPAFPHLGKLRKGDERETRKKDGREYQVFGKELSYWRFTTSIPAIAEAFTAIYGKEPRELNVLLPYARIEDNWQTWQEAWVAGGLQHRCDGQTMTLWLGKDGKYHQEPQPCTGGCKQVGRLCVILPELIRASKHVGYVTMETHSIHDLLSIQGTLMATVEARGHEDLRGIGFILRRVEEEISTPTDSGQRVRRKKWLVKLQPAAEWVAAQLQANTPRYLGSGESVDVVTGEVIEEEPIIEGDLDEDVETPKQAEARRAKHWYNSPSYAKRFDAYYAQQTLSLSEVRQALGLVEDADLRDYPGSATDAKNALDSYVSTKAREALL